MVTVRAPELEPAAAWLNTTRPLSMKELRGQLVILDFWTYCCVNCMHVLPVLRELEHRHKADPLVVIGVHSAKFDAEGDPARVADAIARYGIEHPVVVDRAMGIWDRFAVRSWPTLVFVKPDGTIAAVAPGEPDPDLLEQFVTEQLEEARKKGTLAAAPLHIERLEPQPTATLSYPGKVAVARDGRLAISDSGHHRVLITAPDGEVLHAIGTGERGLRDGTFETCAFDDPQGLAWGGEHTLWICDARNHAVRRADLIRRELTTFAGTGVMGAALHEGTAPAREVALRSPWDVLVDDDTLYVAMAGSHQIWAFDTRKGTGEPFAGSGREALVDGPPEHAAFAQPSGLARRGDALIVADSETSAVRAIDLARDTVETLVGVGLFDFGDADGGREEARLQHALGVAVAGDGAVIVADTYNDTLRRIDPMSGRVGTLYRGEGEQALREPGGIAVEPRARGFVVADTNNHRVVRITDGGEWVEEVAVRGAPEPRRGDVAHAPNPGAAHGAAHGASAGWFTSVLEPQAGRTFREGEVLLSLTLVPPEGWKLNAGSPARAVFEVSRRSDLLSLAAASVQRYVEPDTAFVVTIDGRVEALPAEQVNSEVLVTVDVVLCSEGADARCVPVRAWFRLPITLQRGGDGALGYALPLAAPHDL